MKRSVSFALLLLLLLAAVQVPVAAHAQGTPRVYVRSSYTLSRYGFATVNETVRFTNNGTSAVTAPSLTFGFGDLNSSIAKYNLTVSNGFTLATPASQGGPFTVDGGESIAGGGNTSYVFSALLAGVVTAAKNGSLQVMTLSSPSIGSKVDRLVNVVQMPASTSFRSAPSKLTAILLGTNNTYSSAQTGVTPQAVTSVRAVASSSGQDFNPLRVYGAARTISVATNGTPLVTDTLTFQNMGTTSLTSLYVNVLALSNVQVTVLSTKEPRLTYPVTLALSSGAIPLSAFASGYPTAGVPAGANFTIAYQYPLGAYLYSQSGGQVTTRVSEAPPVSAFIDTYTISLSLPQGASAPGYSPTVLHGATPWQGGVTRFSYGLTFGWAANAGIPAAAVIFVALLIGLFASRTGTAAEAEGEETEEEASTELATDMIKAFEEKTALINGLWPEIEGKDPNEMDRAYFDELRGRLDTFRSRALQRLNEVKQRSASQRFSDVVTQMQATEREVDRAAKDKLNLYQQYSLKQMRKEVYERLLPQYSKRLEKALNQLSDELHNVQREAKLL